MHFVGDGPRDLFHVGAALDMSGGRGRVLSFGIRTKEAAGFPHALRKCVLPALEVRFRNGIVRRRTIVTVLTEVVPAEVWGDLRVTRRANAILQGRRNFSDGVSAFIRERELGVVKTLGLDGVPI